jgi:PhzF family phenazine biosynthesis protein
VSATLVLVDAFAERPFTGNPAAVCLLDGTVADAWMAAVAAEVNLSETAFASAVADGWLLRWFTPTVEVDLCGHATLAAAHALWEGGHLDPGATVRFTTRSGLLTCTRGADGAVSVDLPADPPAPVDDHAVAAALGHPGAPTYRGRAFHLVELDDPGAVRGLDPDLAAIAAACPAGVVATAPGGDGVDCTSRVFAPALGIPEDPVTGAAHCVLAPFWGDRLGRDELVGWQASRRGGRVGMRRHGDRVTLTGRAVVVGTTSLTTAAGPHARGAPGGW